MSKGFMFKSNIRVEDNIDNDLYEDMKIKFTNKIYNIKNH